MIRGTYTYPDGRKYDGEWKDGKFVGKKQPEGDQDKKLQELEKTNQELRIEIAQLKEQLKKQEQ